MLSTAPTVGKKRRLQFNRLSKDEATRNEWLKLMRRKSFKVSKSTRLCSEHFLSAILFLQNVSLYDIVCSKDEFPTLFLNKAVLDAHFFNVFAVRISFYNLVF